jgi:hypothetical protein
MARDPDAPIAPPGVTPTSVTRSLRAAVMGLVWHASGEETLLLATADGEEPGTPTCWSARASVAHNSDFRQEQVSRLTAVRERRQPQEFPQIDHQDPGVYARLAAATPERALDRSRASTISLLDELAATRDEDLLDPSRHAWLRGRKLWLQIVVRGFWHPLGHVGEYYLRHSLSERALALHEHAVATARYLRAPDPAVGMACYSFACAQAVCGMPDAAIESLREAIGLNSDLRDAAAGDPDFESLRRDGRLDRVLGAQ